MSGIVQNKKYRNRQKIKDAFISLFIGVFAVVWMVPILWTLWTSLRPYSDIIQKGVFSRPDTLNLQNYADAYRLMNIWEYLSNSFIVAIPAVVLTLFFGSLLAFVVTRYSFKFNLYLLLLFTAETYCQFNLFTLRYLRCISGLAILLEIETFSMTATSG